MSATPPDSVFDGGVERSSEDERRYRHLRLPRSSIQVLLVSDARCEKRAAAAMCVHGAGARTAPTELPGLPHYLEHMLFLGSHKYPMESHYKKVVALHNGRCNASTSPEETVFHFEVDAGGFQDTLDVFAQFFIGQPLLDWNAAERELNAVTAEDSRNRINDDRRARMVLQHTVPTRDVGVTTWSKFGTGNTSTLGPEAAAAAGIDVRSALWAYREVFYRRDAMALCLISAASLDVLEALAHSVWDQQSGAGNGHPNGSSDPLAATSDAATSDVAEPTAPAPEPLDPALAAAAQALVRSAKDKEAAAGPAHPWAEGEVSWPLLVRVVPVRERRNLSVLWPLGSGCAQHRSARAPVPRYLAHLIGHEGDGSLFATLQAEGLATAVSSSTYIDCPTFCALRVTISLTPAGEQRLETVLHRLYEYIGVVAAAAGGELAAQQWDEMGSLSGINFRYAERGEAMESAKEWSRRLHLYSAQHVLTGGRLLGGFPADQVVESLRMLVPGNSLVLHESRAASCGATMPDEDDESDSVAVAPPAGAGPLSLLDGAETVLEPYYGIEYTRAPLPPSLVARLAAAREAGVRATDGVLKSGTADQTAGDGRLPLHLPRPNSFIPDDFAMLPAPATPVDLARPPLRLDAGSRGSPDLAGERSGGDGRVRLAHWHETEVGFGRPKAHVALAFACSAGCTMLGAPASMILWLRLLDQRLSTALYPAYLAGLRWSLQPNNLGFDLHLCGFLQKLPALAATLVQSVLRWDGDGFAPLFEPRREALVRSLRSHSKSRSDTLASYYLDLLLSPKRVPVPDRLAAAEELTLDRLRDFHAAALARLGARLFTFGNLGTGGAVTLAEGIRREMEAAGAAPLPRAEWAASPVTRVPRGSWRLRLQPLSEEENNSGVACYYQCGRLGEDVGSEAALRLFLRLVKQPLFDELRTRQQLGYAVSCSLRYTGRGLERVAGFQVMLLSKSYAPPHLQRAIDAYLAGVSQMLVESVSDDEYQTTRRALVTRLLEPDRTLAEAFETRWAPIEEEDFFFDRNVRLAAALEATPLADVIALARAALGYPRLLVHVFGNPHKAAFDEEDGTGATPIEECEAWRAAQDVWPSLMPGE